MKELKELYDKGNTFLKVMLNRQLAVKHLHMLVFLHPGCIREIC